MGSICKSVELQQWENEGGLPNKILEAIWAFFETMEVAMPGFAELVSLEEWEAIYE